MRLRWGSQWLQEQEAEKKERETNHKRSSRFYFSLHRKSNLRCCVSKPPKYHNQPSHTNTSAPPSTRHSYRCMPFGSITTATTTTIIIIITIIIISVEAYPLYQYRWNVCASNYLFLYLPTSIYFSPFLFSILFFLLLFFVHFPSLPYPLIQKLIC